MTLILCSLKGFGQGRQISQFPVKRTLDTNTYFLGQEKIGASWSNGQNIPMNALVGFLSISAGIPFSDTGIIVTTITQLNDSLKKYVKCADSTTRWVTFTQLKDSLNYYVPFRDSTTFYVTPTQLRDSGYGKISSITFANGLKTTGANPIIGIGTAIADSTVVPFWQDTNTHKVVTNTYLQTQLTSNTLNQVLTNGNTTNQGFKDGKIVSSHTYSSIQLGLLSDSSGHTIWNDSSNGSHVNISDTNGDGEMSIKVFNNSNGSDISGSHGISYFYGGYATEMFNNWFQFSNNGYSGHNRIHASSTTNSNTEDSLRDGVNGYFLTTADTVGGTSDSNYVVTKKYADAHYGGGSGTVTSVTLSLPTDLTGGSTITTSGTWTVSHVTNFTITDAANFVYNGNNGSVQTETMGANRTFTITNLLQGVRYTFVVNHSSSAYSLTWGTTVIVSYGGAGVPPQSTSASAKDYYYFTYDGTNINVDYSLNSN